MQASNLQYLFKVKHLRAGFILVAVLEPRGHKVDRINLPANDTSERRGFLN